jgi:predicted phage terminase large subunit-like protein
MWVLGFMYGDGWITLHPNDKGSMRWVTCVAVSKQKWKNERIKRFFKACFNTTLKETDFGYYRTEVADVGRYFEAAGFKADATAKTKRIPKYVFTLAEDLRQAFLDGFVAADGHIQRNGLSAIELSNIELIKDLKLLASSLGYKVSNVYERERITQPPHSPQPIKSHTAHISFGKRRSETVFGLVPVISIDYYEKAVTYDLTVSNTHCFIAEGLVVHNTRWHYDDYWNNLIQKSIENGGMYVVKVYRPTEDMNDPASPLKALWPDVWSVDQLLARKAEIGTIRFNSLYLNDPSGYEGLIFKEKWLRYYNPYSLHFIQNMQLFMGVDPNISEDPTSDYTAIVVLGFDPSKGEFYVLDIFRKQIEFPDQVREIKAIYEKWRNIVQYYNLEKSNRWVGPLNVGVETVAYQKALARTVFMQGIPVKEINRKTDKLTRMVGLSPHFEGGRFHFPDPSIEPTPWLQPFIDEYVSFPKGKNDDQLDAIDCAVECADITKGKTGFYFG